MKKDLKRRIALQLMFLLEENNLGLILTRSKESFFSDHSDQHRILLTKFLTAGVQQQVIPSGITDPWKLTTAIRPFFEKVRAERIRLLTAAGHSDDFVFPYNPKEFTINGTFAITKTDLDSVKFDRAKQSELAQASQKQNYVEIHVEESNTDNTELYASPFPELELAS